MRVGLVIYGPLSTMSGGFMYDRKIVEHLRESGDEVEVISLPWDSYPRLLTHNFSDSLQRRITGLGLDLLLEDELNHPSLFRLNRSLKGIPKVSIVHHLRSKESHAGWAMPFYRWVETRYLESVDGFIFNSRTTRSDVAEALADLKSHVIAYPGGDRLKPDVTPQKVMERASAAGALKLLFIGNLIPRKGLHTLIDALALSGEGWRLDVVGPEADPGYAARVRAQVYEKGLSDRIRFRGALDDEALKGALEESHVLAVPSSYEGFGIVYMEGMGFGLPALATTSGAASETIRHGENGFLIAPGDAAGLGRHVMRLAQDRALLGRMGLEALTTYQAHPTWGESVDTVRRFLLETAGRGLRIA